MDFFNINFNQYESDVGKLRQAKNEYYENHKRCPKCMESKFRWQTLVGYIMHVDRIDEYKDLNESHCRCGWVGSVHDLLPIDLPKQKASDGI